MTGSQFNKQALFRKPVQRVFKRIAIFAHKPQFANKLFISSAAVRQHADVLQQSSIIKLCSALEKLFRRAAGMLGHYRNYRRDTRILIPAIVPAMELKAIRLEIPENGNIIVGQSHFIKTVEDIYEAIVNTSPHIQFGIAFNEASGDCLTRFDGNDNGLKQNAVGNATAIGAGHVFVVALRNGFPINVLGRIQTVPEVAAVFCATANPVEVIVAETEQGRGVLGVIDGYRPKGVEDESHVQARVALLQKFGYKR